MIDAEKYEIFPDYIAVSRLFRLLRHTRLYISVVISTADYMISAYLSTVVQRGVRDGNSYYKIM